MKRHLIVGLPAALFLLSMVASASADPPTKANNPLVLKEQVMSTSAAALSCAAPTPPMLRYQATELLQGISRFIKPTSNIKFLLPRSTSTQLS